MNAQLKPTDFQPGQIANPLGGKSHKTPARRALSKAQKALNKAIDLLGKDTIHNNGSTVLAELIADALRKDVVGTLSKLHVLLPKQLEISNDNLNALTMSDDQLLQVIASRHGKDITDQCTVTHQETDKDQ